MKYTEEQNAIIESSDRRIVVLACPGSGKTAVISQKYINLINAGVEGKHILSLSFTRKAANEMLDRITKGCQISKAAQRNISTLHSIGCKIVYQYHDLVGLKNGYQIATRQEREDIAREVLSEKSNATDIIVDFLKFVSAIKNGYQYVSNYTFSKENYVNYHKAMISENLIDLDDFILLPVKILQDNAHIRNKLQREFKYIFVDEYQDINSRQEQFINCLCGPDCSLMLVGDDDQAIYEFRGSDSSFIVNKTKKPEFSVFVLSRNFRSQRSIVELSQKILEPIDESSRTVKKIISDKNSNEAKPVRKQFDSKESEINYVVNEIYRLITESRVEPEEIAVLSRYNSREINGTQIHPELNQISRKLEEKGIHVSKSVSYGDDKSIAKVIRLIVKMLRNLRNDEIEPEFLNVMKSNIYKKESFDKTLHLIDTEYDSHISDIESFETIMDEIVRMSPVLSSRQFNKRVERYIDAYSFVKKEHDKVINGALPSEIIDDLMKYSLENEMEHSEVYNYASSFAKACEESFDGESKIENYDSTVCNIEMFLHEKQKEQHHNSVKFITAHQSKGLQFDVVFVVGLEVGNFPSTMETLEGSYLDNERRLFYVCVTRARELLYLTSTGIVERRIDSRLAGKSFVYSLPLEYFSDSYEVFDDVAFTEHESYSIKLLKESDEIVQRLEQDYLDKYNAYMTLENEYKRLVEHDSYSQGEIANIQLEMENQSEYIIKLEEEKQQLIEANKELEDNKQAIYDKTILNYPEAFLSGEKRTMVINLYRELTKDNGPFSLYIRSGVGVLNELIMASIEYLNGRIDIKQFERNLKSYNFKGNMDIIVRGILEACSGYRRSDAELKIGRFLDAYVNKNTDVEYSNYIEQFKLNNHSIDLSLVEGMSKMNAITTGVNHDSNKIVSNRNLQRTKELVNDILRNPSREYIDIFLSYFVFLDKYIENDKIMNYVAKLI